MLSGGVKMQIIKFRPFKLTEIHRTSLAKMVLYIQI